MGGMGGVGGMSYGSPYNRFGGGMYGGGFGGGYGMGQMGYGMQQPGYGPNPDQSLTHTYQQSTQATFQMIESIVGAFGGFAYVHLVVCESVGIAC